MVKIHIDYNVADLLTKAFDVTSGLYIMDTQIRVQELSSDENGLILNAGDFVNAADVSHVGLHHITNGHQFTMSNGQERIGYSRANNNCPTIYDSYIKQFWNTATSKIVNYVKQIHAIVDGLTNAKIFENLALMGYEQPSTKLTFQKGNITPIFASMLVQHQAPKGEGSAIPPGSQPTLSTSQPIVLGPHSESLQIETPLTTTPQTEVFQAVISPSPTTYQRTRKTHKRRRTKKDIELPQTSVPLYHGADKAAHKEGVIIGGSPKCQETIGGAMAQVRPEGAPIMSSDPPLSPVNTCGSGKDRMEQTFELTDNVPPTPNASPLSLVNTEKKYPLIKEVLLKMLELQLETKEGNTMVLELIKFIKK
ncbi:hypothetical protein Tco_1117041 [Tanacetum coccineum]